jgi:transcriptional regulator with XRE-family HTH domain
MKKYRPIPAEEVFAKQSPESQARIKARAAELIAEHFALRDLRRSKKVTQEEIAERLGGRQVYVSRLERRADMKLSTLRDYVQALGGDLQLVVTFPEGETVRLGNFGEESAAWTGQEKKSESIKRRRAKA